MQSSEQYEVALSYAGEQRCYVQSVARALQSRGIAIFYDGFEPVQLWGKHGTEFFDQVFAQQAKYAAMFISKDYVGKMWPRFERRSILSRAVQEGGDYILPVRFDDTPVPGLPADLIYLRAEDHTPAVLAAKISEKLGIEPFAGKAHEVPPPRAVSMTGEAVFDYGSYNGRYVLGRRTLEFETKWSQASDTKIHLYNDPPSINGVALAPGCTSIAEVVNAKALDYTSLARTVGVGEVAVLRNTNRFYAALQVVTIKDRSRADDRDELRFLYAIQSDGSDNFSEFEGI